MSQPRFRRKTRRASSARERAAGWRGLARAAESLVVLRGVLDDAAGQAWRAPAAYARLFTLLAAETELGAAALVGDAWQTHLVGRLLDDDNPFSHKAERAPWSALG